MTIGTMDIYLLVIIVASLVIGFFWGAARSVMLLAAWLLAFLAGAYLKLQLGSYLAKEWPNYNPGFADMAAFGIIYLGLLIAAPILIVASTKGDQRITRNQTLDDLVSAVFAMFVAILGIAGLLIVFATYYGNDVLAIDAQGGPEWTANLYRSMLESNIGGAIADELVPILGSILGPIMPPDVREVMV
jgi:uncharacterized membrane protein required for colicin V production